ncbi:hypothetical protein XENTR_v10019737 [Xenopus tropicalis]|nr:hypothetical protein XENTR_v10019737 [Xenopus tropicalis]
MFRSLVIGQKEESLQPRTICHTGTKDLAFKVTVPSLHRVTNCYIRCSMMDPLQLLFIICPMAFWVLNIIWSLFFLKKLSPRIPCCKKGYNPNPRIPWCYEPSPRILVCTVQGVTSPVPESLGVMSPVPRSLSVLYRGLQAQSQDHLVL